MSAWPNPPTPINTDFGFNWNGSLPPSPPPPPPMFTSGVPPPPPPPPPPGKSWIQTSIDLSEKKKESFEEAQLNNLPKELMSTFAQKDKKPFSYAPLSLVSQRGMLDVNQIKSPRMRKRLLLNQQDDQKPQESPTSPIRATPAPRNEECPSVYRGVFGHSPSSTPVQSKAFKVLEEMTNKSQAWTPRQEEREEEEHQGWKERIPSASFRYLQSTIPAVWTPPSAQESPPPLVRQAIPSPSFLYLQSSLPPPTPQRTSASLPPFQGTDF